MGSIGKLARHVGVVVKDRLVSWVGNEKVLTPSWKLGCDWEVVQRTAWLRGIGGEKVFAPSWKHGRLQTYPLYCF